jgi:hypothetical protein
MTWLTAIEYLCHKWPQKCSTCRKHFPVLSSFMTYHRVLTRLTRQVPLVEQELPTLPEHLSSFPVFSGVYVARSLVLCVGFVDSCFFPFVLLAIVLSVLRYADSDYPFGIFKSSWCKLNMLCFVAINSTCMDMLLLAQHVWLCCY